MMANNWLPWAVDDPAPADHCGYGLLGIPRELADPSLRRGQTVHSVEGWFTYVNPSAVMRARGNSWGVTIMRSGQVWRHRPRPTFVNWHAGGPAQNIGTDGIEMEGKDQPWTDAQRESLVRVLQETREWLGWPAYAAEDMGAPTAKTQESIRRALLGWGYGSLWEHNWFDYTTCPSGRDDWGWLMSALQEENSMADFSDEQKAYLAGYGARLARGIAWALAAGGMNTEMKRGDPDWKPPYSLKDVLAAISGIPSGSGGGVSEAKVEEIVKRLLESQKTVIE